LGVHRLFLSTSPAGPIRVTMILVESIVDGCV
jgi:hypothetical protein